MNKCLVLLTHKIDEYLMAHVSYLKKSVEGVMDFYLLYDTENEDVSIGEGVGLHIWRFKHSDYPKWVFMGNDGLYMYLYPLIDFAKEYPYKHYLFMENDIVLNGDFGAFAEKVADVDVDYMHIKRESTTRLNKHREVLVEGECFDIIRFSWSNMELLSARYLDAIDKFLATNDKVFLEVLLPSLAYELKESEGYTVGVFEELGYRFVVGYRPVGKYEEIYVKQPKPDYFYHPIKNLSLVGLKNDIPFKVTKKNDRLYNRGFGALWCYLRKNAHGRRLVVPRVGKT